MTSARNTHPWRSPRQAPADASTARAEAERCIQCPDPSCVSGCPVCNPIHQWLQLTADGRIEEAASLLCSVSSLADICTRLCPSEHLCEHHCLLDSVGEPVSIRAIEQFLADYAALHDLAEDPATAPPNGRKVAIIGSGLGPLACADCLSKLGWGVVLFEPGPTPGGDLLEAVVTHQLERQLLDRRLNLLEKRGVQIRLNIPLPDADALRALSQEYDAVYLAPDPPPSGFQPVTLSTFGRFSISTLSLSVPPATHIYAGGAVVRGQCDPVHAIADARRAAELIAKTVRN